MVLTTKMVFFEQLVLSIIRNKLGDKIAGQKNRRKILDEMRQSAAMFPAFSRILSSWKTSWSAL